MLHLNRRSAMLAGLIGIGSTGVAAAAGQAHQGAGVVVLRSARPFRDTIVLLKQDIAAKQIMMFAKIDQADLTAKAGIKLPPSTLLIFGNPPLGIQFLTANPWAGLDWPVRLLVTQDAAGAAWLAYSDFAWIAERHGIVERNDAFAKATMVISSIAASVGAGPP